MMQATPFHIPIVQGAEHYRFVRKGATITLKTTANRVPQKLGSGGATRDEILKAPSEGYDGIAICHPSGDIEYHDYPGKLNAPAPVPVTALAANAVQPAASTLTAMTVATDAAHAKASISTPRNSATESVFAQFAWKFIERGISVVPIAPGTKKPGQWSQEHGWRGMSDWTRFANRLPSEIELEHWEKWPDAGIGVVLGPVSNLMCLDKDYDIPNGGDQALLAIIPYSPIAKKGEKGWTRFYQFNGEQSCSFDVGGVRVLDVLADGRQTVVPPTMHPSGCSYVWITEEGLDSILTTKELPKLPEDFLAQVERVLAPYQNDQDIKHQKKTLTPKDDSIQINTDLSIQAAYFRDLNRAALNNLDAWVPKIVPTAKSHNDGYRCIATWRGAKNHNVGINAAGIRDWGGGCGMTAIDIIMHSNGLPFQKAAEVLRSFVLLPDDLSVDLSMIVKQGPGLRSNETAASQTLAATVGNSTATSLPQNLPDWTPRLVGTPLNSDFGADLIEQSIFTHPLSLKNAIQLKGTPEAVNFVVHDFIQEGVVFFAGQQGVGKTSALLPLAMAQAGLHEPGYQFAPPKQDRWRHIIYLTEDTEQVGRIIAAMVTQGYFTLEQVQERIHVVPAKAMAVETFVMVRKEYAELVADESGVQLLPLVVADTRSACFVLESENDNAEMSKLVAELKQNFAELPIWVIGHLAKETATRSNASTLSVRGAGSAEGDAHQVLFLVKDEANNRWLVRGKTRFESPWQELSMRSNVVCVEACDRWGDQVSMNVRWSIAEAPEHGRAELVERAKVEAEKADQAELRDVIRNIVQEAWNLKHPLNKQGVKGKVKRKAAKVIAVIDTLLAEGWLYEVSVPSKERVHTNRSSFLVNLSTEQHESYMADGEIPSELLVIPKSWRKASIPSVPYENDPAIEKVAI